MQHLILGPFLTPNGRRGEICSELIHCGYDLEFATSKQAFKVCLYRRLLTWRDYVEFEDFVFHEDEAPVDVVSSGIYVLTTELGRFFPVQSIILNLFSDPAMLPGLETCLREFRACLPITPSQSAYSRVVVDRDCTSTHVLERGFRVISFFGYGRSLTAQLGWVFPQDRDTNDDNTCFLCACNAEFKPRPDRSLNAGKWVEPQEGYFPGLLQRFLRSIEPEPQKVLSPRGHEVALRSFEWTPLSLLTAAEAKRARIEFIKRNVDLLTQPKELAQALRREGLYAESTTPAQIVKSLPSLIRAATR